MIYIDRLFVLFVCFSSRGSTNGRRSFFYSELQLVPGFLYYLHVSLKLVIILYQKACLKKQQNKTKTKTKPCFCFVLFCFFNTLQNHCKGGITKLQASSLLLYLLHLVCIWYVYCILAIFLMIEINMIWYGKKKKRKEKTNKQTKQNTKAYVHLDS